MTFGSNIFEITAGNGTINFANTASVGGTNTIELGRGDGETGGKYVCSPPPRDHQSWEAIWEGIRTGVFQTFSSDHCPFTYGSINGKLNPKARTSFRWVPNGIPGVETRMQILFSRGVVEGRITLN